MSGRQYRLDELSEFDRTVYPLLRTHVDELIRKTAARFDRPGLRVLDIAPQVHAGAKAHFKQAIIETLDINPDAGATYTADLTDSRSSRVPSARFDLIVCTEVLEHTTNPFTAMKELERMLKLDGYLALSVPFNFRIHGPLPDCWRISEHGLRALLQNFSIILLDALESPDRPLMPIHYNVLAQRQK